MASRQGPVTEDRRARESGQGRMGKRGNDKATLGEWTDEEALPEGRAPFGANQRLRTPVWNCR